MCYSGAWKIQAKACYTLQAPTDPEWASRLDSNQGLPMENDSDDPRLLVATQIHNLEVRVLVLEAQVTALMDREFPPVGALEDTEPHEFD